MIPRTSVAVLLFALACAGTASGQQDVETGEQDILLAGDVPQWLENFGFEDELNLDGYAVSQVEEGRVGASGACSGGQCGCLRCRDKLTGDWFGRRAKLQQGGIAYKGRVTLYFFGVGGGVNEPILPPLAAMGISGGDRYEYTGNSRHDFLFDLNKVAGFPGRFVVTLENIWGHWGNVSFETGAASPAVLGAVFPIDTDASGIPYVTNFLLALPISDHLIVTVGKTRMPSLADNNIFAGGDGSDQFSNQTFASNPLLLPQVPFSTFCVTTVMPQDWGNIAFMVLDPQEKATDFMQFDELFATGVGLLGQVQVDTKFLGKPGEHHVGFWYKNVDQIDLAFTPLPPTYPYSPASPGIASKTETYSLFYGFDQYLTTYGPPDARGNSEGWGLFGRAGLADDGRGNPSFGAWHVSAGIGGDSAFQGRRGKGDRFGLAYGYTATSTEYGPIPTALLGPRDAQVIELYYRYHLTPAIEVTPDVQLIRGMLGALSDGDGAVVAGIRLNMKL